jgi:Na+/melibiose symporter-like transporter
VPGAILLAAGLLALVVPLIEGRERGWPAWCVVLLAASLPLLWTFWRHEKHIERAGGTPLVVPSLLAAPGLRRSLAATFCFYAIAPFFLVFAIYEQAGLSHDALAAGLAILPLGVGFLLGPLCSPRIAQHLGARTAAFGMGLEVLGMLVAAALAVAEWPQWMWMPLFVIGLGQGIALPALVRLSVDQVNARWAGLASGLVNATLQVSAAVSVALIGGFFFTLAPEGASAREVQVGFAATAIVIGVLLGFAAVLSKGIRPAPA